MGGNVIHSTRGGLLGLVAAILLHLILLSPFWSDLYHLPALAVFGYGSLDDLKQIQMYGRRLLDGPALDLACEHARLYKAHKNSGVDGDVRPVHPPRGPPHLDRERIGVRYPVHLDGHHHDAPVVPLPPDVLSLSDARDGRADVQVRRPLEFELDRPPHLELLAAPPVDQIPVRPPFCDRHVERSLPLEPRAAEWHLLRPAGGVVPVDRHVPKPLAEDAVHLAHQGVRRHVRQRIATGVPRGGLGPVLGRRRRTALTVRAGERVA
mmetsp:Transcript_1540/g.3577  ORF Transcript_1540/g.3577 Transcript_1540/m.3577 type:complete len:265 (+) Transcript_1540:663-1457(+)